ALHAIEPFDDAALEPAGRDDHRMGTRRAGLGRMDSRRIIHADDPERLQPALALGDLANDTGAFVSGLKSVTTEASHMQKDIRRTIIRQNETIALRSVEPLDRTNHLEQIQAALFLLP